MFFDPKNFDPSKLDPKLVAELSDLMRQLPSDKIMKMQSLMHNSMAGFDVKNEMIEFENSLPTEFRQKLFQIISRGMSASAAAPQTPTQTSTQISETEASNEKMTVREARLTLLRAVAAGSLAPEAALSALFSEE